MRLTGKLTVVATLDCWDGGLLHPLTERFMVSYLVTPDVINANVEYVLARLPSLWDTQQRLSEVCRTVTGITVVSAVAAYIRRLVTAVRQHMDVGFYFPHWNVVRHLTTMAKAWALLQVNCSAPPPPPPPPHPRDGYDVDVLILVGMGGGGGGC